MRIMKKCSSSWSIFIILLILKLAIKKLISKASLSQHPMPVDATVHPLDIDKKSTSLENPGPIKIESIM